MNDDLPPLPTCLLSLNEYQRASIAGYARAYAEQRVAAERERCAKLLDSACIAHARGRQLKILRPSDSWEGAPWRPWRACGVDDDV